MLKNQQAVQSKSPPVAHLHLAFHGCLQSVRTPDDGDLRDEFLREGGYNRWAGGNRIVVVYPQIEATTENPRGCWDFWGYSGPAWRTQDGVQMRAVAAVIAAMIEYDTAAGEAAR